jgi:AraC family transcriptional regulator
MIPELSAYSQNVESIQRSILARSVHPAPGHARLPSRVLQRLSEHIVQNLEEPLNLDALAGIAGLSVSHFSRCFRNSTGMTPHVYVMHQRLCEAEFLLALSELRLTDIALGTGFADQSHFTRRFQRRTGLTPSMFRSLYR